MDGRVPVLLCVDVEPDDHVFPPEDPSPWQGFELLTERIEALRDRLSSLTGEPARFNWAIRMDPQIAEGYGDPGFIVDRHRRFFEAVRGRGDALGVHPHAWRWDRGPGVWVADHADPAWVDRCVEMSFGAYRSLFGELPGHHRFGARFVSERLLATVRRLGGRVDLTLEPGEPAAGPGERMGGVWTGVIPDYREVPRVPYRPDPADFRRPAPAGGGELWAVPLTSGRLLLHPRRILAIRRLLRHPGRRPRRVGLDGQDRTLAMWRDWRTPAAFWDSAFGALRELERPYLAFAIRSDTPVRPSLAERFDRIMAALPERPEAGRLVFTTPPDALLRMGLAPGG